MCTTTFSADCTTTVITNVTRGQTAKNSCSENWNRDYEQQNVRQSLSCCTFRAELKDAHICFADMLQLNMHLLICHVQIKLSMS